MTCFRTGISIIVALDVISVSFNILWPHLLLLFLYRYVKCDHVYNEQRTSGSFFCCLILSICTLVFFMAAAQVKSPEQISHFCTSVTDRPLSVSYSSFWGRCQLLCLWKSAFKCLSEWFNMKTRKSESLLKQSDLVHTTALTLLMTVWTAWAITHPELVRPELIDVGPLPWHRLVPEAELQQELVLAGHEHLTPLLPVGCEVLSMDTQQSAVMTGSYGLMLQNSTDANRKLPNESIPCSASACSSPLSAQGIHLCNATGELRKGRNV